MMQLESPHLFFIRRSPPVSKLTLNVYFVVLNVFVLVVHKILCMPPILFEDTLETLFGCLIVNWVSVVQSLVPTDSGINCELYVE
jgi:hypothetical protein